MNEGAKFGEGFAATVIHAQPVKASLRLIIIADDDAGGVGAKNLSPIAQQELCKLELNRDPSELLAKLGQAFQDALRPILESKD